MPGLLAGLAAHRSLFKRSEGRIAKCAQYYSCLTSTCVHNTLLVNQGGGGVNEHIRKYILCLLQFLQSTQVGVDCAKACLVESQTWHGVMKKS